MCTMTQAAILVLVFLQIMIVQSALPSMSPTLSQSGSSPGSQPSRNPTQGQSGGSPSSFTLQPSRVPTTGGTGGVLPSLMPTQGQSRGSPVPTSGVSSPTLAPTPPATSDVIVCPTYTISNSYYATQNYAICSATVCEGETLSADNCALCGDGQFTYAYLYNSSYQDVGDANGYSDCGCQHTSLSYTRTSPGCESIMLREGCYGANTCTSTFTIKVGRSPTMAPTYIANIESNFFVLNHYSDGNCTSMIASQLVELNSCTYNGETYESYLVTYTDSGYNVLNYYVYADPQCSQLQGSAAIIDVSFENCAYQESLGFIMGAVLPRSDNWAADYGIGVIEVAYSSSNFCDPSTGKVSTFVSQNNCNGKKFYSIVGNSVQITEFESDNCMGNALGMSTVSGASLQCYAGSSDDDGDDSSSYANITSTTYYIQNKVFVWDIYPNGDCNFPIGAVGYPLEVCVVVSEGFGAMYKVFTTSNGNLTFGIFYYGDESCSSMLNNGEAMFKQSFAANGACATNPNQFDSKYFSGRVVMGTYAWWENGYRNGVIQETYGYDGICNGIADHVTTYFSNDYCVDGSKYISNTNSNSILYLEFQYGNCTGNILYNNTFRSSVVGSCINDPGVYDLHDSVDPIVYVYSIHSASLQDLGVCAFINSTNIGTLHNEWSCVNGEVASDPCLGWYGVNCNLAGQIIEFNFNNSNLQGKF